MLVLQAGAHGIAHAIGRVALFETVLKGAAVEESQVLCPFTEGDAGPKDYLHGYDAAKTKKRIMAWEIGLKSPPSGSGEAARPFAGRATLSGRARGPSSSC